MAKKKTTKKATTKKTEQETNIKDESQEEVDDILDEEVPDKEPQEEGSQEEEEVKTQDPQTVADGELIVEVKPGGGRAEIMRRKLAAQPKVPIMIPLEGNEPMGATFPLILDDYRLNIKKGVYVHVPKQAAEVIMKSQRQTTDAIYNYFRMNEQGVSQAMRDKGLGPQ